MHWRGGLSPVRVRMKCKLLNYIVFAFFSAKSNNRRSIGICPWRSAPTRVMWTFQIDSCWSGDDPPMTLNPLNLRSEGRMCVIDTKPETILFCLWIEMTIKRSEQQIQIGIAIKTKRLLFVPCIHCSWPINKVSIATCTGDKFTSRSKTEKKGTTQTGFSIRFFFFWETRKKLKMFKSLHCGASMCIRNGEKTYIVMCGWPIDIGRRRKLWKRVKDR